MLTESSYSESIVDVQLMKNGLLEIHIFCSRPKPDLSYLISKTLEDLGLIIQDAMIANFDVFKLDLRAQQRNGGQYVRPDQIKLILLDLVGDRGALQV
ncbi:transcription factor SCREAM2 [Artemisia annua]|uniref:Transcription factor SCREAM2 n=1 Tax=Artemisia annua TaxID=35608 RepID=A0A2U1LUH9_ARTAN|nr:transcription factor SCREAM2 [Artemisia annua]